jgi:hypothetical protein
MKEQKILEYLRELNKAENKFDRLGRKTFPEIMGLITERFKVEDRIARKVLVKYLDEEFEV